MLERGTGRVGGATSGSASRDVGSPGGGVQAFAPREALSAPGRGVERTGGGSCCVRGVTAAMAAGAFPGMTEGDLGGGRGPGTTIAGAMRLAAGGDGVVGGGSGVGGRGAAVGGRALCVAVGSGAAGGFADGAGAEAGSGEAWRSFARGVGVTASGVSVVPSREVAANEMLVWGSASGDAGGAAEESRGRAAVAPPSAPSRSEFSSLAV